MAQIIRTLDSPYYDQTVTLSNNTYNLLFKFNTSDLAWYLTIRDEQLNIIVSGIKIMPNQNLTKRFDYLQKIVGGNIWCFRRKKDFTPIGRDNLGYQNTYELWWLTSQEEEDFNYDGVIQL